MELVANVWPIVDGASQIILRFAARGYVMEADDSVISDTLLSLAPSDFVLAQQFKIPERFVLVSEHGQLVGAVTPADFNARQANIIEEALRTLEFNMGPLHGVGVTRDGEPFQRRVPVAFSQQPYLVVTFLIEDAAGELNVYSSL